MRSCYGRLKGGRVKRWSLLVAKNRADEAVFDILSLVAPWKDDLYVVMLGDVVVRRIERLDEPSVLRVPPQDADGGAARIHNA